MFESHLEKGNTEDARQGCKTAAILREDHSRIRSSGAPFIMSHIRNAFITMCREVGLEDAAATVREQALTLHVLLTRPGIVDQSGAVCELGASRRQRRHGDPLRQRWKRRQEATN